MNSLTDLSLLEAKSALLAKKISASELTAAHVKVMERLRPLNIYITETAELAMEAAKASDIKIAKGEAGALEGLPIANKDLYCTKGVETTAGSKILKGFIPPYESTVTQKLKDSGAISLGKVNLDEFAMGSATNTSFLGNTISPWQDQSNLSAKLTAGGSSGGSAAIVAARGSLAATGTDTGGSIRQPASFCGIVGIKPTYGRCSRWGIVAFASSLDQAGPMTRTVADSALMLSIMAGHDAKDSTSAKQEVPDFLKACDKPVKGLRIGIPRAFEKNGLDPEIAGYWNKAADDLAKAGAVLVDIELPHSELALPAYYIIAPAEASSNLARYDGVRYGYRADEKANLDALYIKTRGEGFGAEVKRRIMMGTYVLSAGYYDAYYRQAQKLRTLIADDFKQAYEKCDVILTPTAPSSAFAHDINQDDPITMYLNDIFTVPVNLAGLPAISIPIGLDKKGLPLGLQFIGRAFDENSLFTVASALEKIANFTARPSL